MIRKKKALLHHKHNDSYSTKPVSKDADLIQKAVAHKPWAVQYADSKTRKRPEIFWTLINGGHALLALQFAASGAMCDQEDLDEKWLRAALTCPLEVIHVIKPKHLRTLSFAKSLVKKDGRVLPFLPKELRDRKDVVALALESDPNVLWRRLPYEAECEENATLDDAGYEERVLFRPLTARSARGGTGRVNALRYYNENVLPFQNKTCDRLFTECYDNFFRIDFGPGDLEEARKSNPDEGPPCFFVIDDLRHDAELLTKAILKGAKRRIADLFVALPHLVMIKRPWEPWWSTHWAALQVIGAPFRLRGNGAKVSFGLRCGGGQRRTACAHTD
eukprot:g17434.t1